MTQVPAILPARAPTPHEGWATLPSGAVKRLEFNACSQPEALSIAFALAPGAVAISVRELDRRPPTDALAELDRRASSAGLPPAKICAWADRNGVPPGGAQ